MNSIDPKEKLTKFSDHWHPHQIGVVNDMQVLVAKVKDEFVWHQHEEEDELFQVLKGTLCLQFEDKTETVKEGEIIIVPKGVKHCPMTKNGEEVHIMLFEKLSTRHSGEVEDSLTQTDYPKI
ncbi:Mannose-6-phosphate isomerase, cupin superfamily [Salinimicrobium catena]|uniref:Mannose-6-phosphate isomerase, cupin superfamily n=1 Tax=Salinimicrobium catena TaxID=390640 RepID=A0A1H5HXZ9_9FLAO|nr:cupin domain-containing protein [Salinimicrobium catena]SDK73645.1 Mannose-6-phosphate isomerase, cupin superfamily [Salinimicrobium catena]SEE32807.1 Mannose-6-phosphate isomerase, cupin superfamily [Salinimicrobium catena]